MAQVQESTRTSPTAPSGQNTANPAGPSPQRAAGYADGRRALRPQQPRGFWQQVGDRAAEAGGWVADKANDAAEWTRDAAGQVTDWAGNAMDTAGSLWDTARNTDVDVGGKGISASVRVRDLQKALPPEAAAALGFDERGLEDRVQADYRYGSDSITLRAPRLSLSSLNVQGFRSGAASGTDVVVVLSNPGGRIPFLQDGWQSSGNLRVAVTIASAVGENVSYGTAEPLAKAERVELRGISVTGAAPTARVTGAGSGNLAGSFSVQRAVISGLSAPGASARDVTVSGARADWREDTGRVNARAAALSTTGLNAGSTQLQHGSASNVTASLDARGGTARAESLGASGVTTGGASIGALRSSDVSAGWNTQARTAQLSAGRASATDFASGNTRAASVHGAGANVAYDGRSLSGGAQSVGVQGLRTGEVGIGNGAIEGLSASQNLSNGGFDAAARRVTANELTGSTFGATSVTGTGVTLGRNAQADAVALRTQALEAQGLNASGVTAASLQAGNMSYAHDGRVQGNQFAADTLGLSRLSSAHGGAESVSARGLAVNTAAGQLDVSTQGLSGRNIASPYANAAALDAEGLRVGVGQRGYDASLTSASAQSLSASGFTADQLRAGGFAANGSSGAGHTATLGSLSGTGLRHGELSAGTGELSQARLQQSASATQLGVGNAAFGDLRLQQPGAQLSAGSASVSGLALNRSASETTVDVASARASQLSGTTSLDRPGAPLRVPYADLSRHSLEGQVSLNAGTVRLGAGSGALTRDAARLVDDASLRASVPLLAGDHGAVEVEQGTNATARLGVKDGQLVPGQTDLQLSRPLDGPLWTTVRGVELESAGRRHPGRGKLRADVGGFFDPSVSSDVMGALGSKDKTVPLGVSELADLASRNTPDAAGRPDQVTLARERESDNTVSVRSDAQGAVANFVRLLVGSFQVRMGNTSVEAGRTSVGGGALEARGAPAQPEQLSGTIDALEIHRVHTTTSR